MSFGGFPFGGAPFGSLGDSYQETTISEALALASSMELSETTVLEQDLDLATSLTSTEVSAIIASLALSGTPVATGAFAATLVNALQLSTTLIPVLQAIIDDELALTGVLTATPVRMVSLVDSLVLSGAATGSLNALAIISDALALLDVVQSVQLGEIEDTLDLTDEITTRLSAFEALTAELAFSDTLIGLAVVTVLVSESLDLSDTSIGLGTFLATITEELDLAVSFTFDDTPYIGLAMNPATRAITEYTNWAANSLANFDRKLYGAFDDGLYLMEGTDDAGTEIEWRFRTGLSRLGTGKEKRLEAAYYAIRADGAVFLKCVYVPGRDGGGEKLEQWYSLRPADGGVLHEGRVKPGRGMKAVFWAFELAGAGDMDFDTLELHPLILDRRI